MDADLDRLSTFGALLIVEPSGTRLTADEQALLREVQPAGVMLRARNFAFHAPYHEWLAELRELRNEISAAVSGRPIIWSIDHEGGRVIRPPSPITRFPYARRWGAHVGAVAAAMALELRSLGINVNFAPVADVDLGCPVIGQRAFSDQPLNVAHEAVQFMQELERGGVRAVAKHFPGHGRVPLDSHDALPVLDLSRQELEQTELLPFRALIGAGLSAIMTAHLQVPALDAEYPATVSSELLRTLLRETLGFDGVVFADALGMAGISQVLSQGALARKGIEASLDLFLMVGDTVTTSQVYALAEDLRRVAREERKFVRDIVAARARVARFVRALPQHPVEALSPELLARHQSLASELDPTGEWQNYQYIPPGFD